MKDCIIILSVNNSTDNLETPETKTKSVVHARFGVFLFWRYYEDM